MNIFRKEEIFKTNLQKLSKLSRDDTNNVIMICSEIEAVNYDNVKNKYSKYKKIYNLKSNDVLYEKSKNYKFNSKDEYFFIEFKNGKINNKNEFDNKIIFEIKEKIYDSVIILLELIEKDFEYLRNNFSYILVYNEIKNSSKEKIKMHIIEKSQGDIIKFGLDKFKGYLFKEVYTCTEKEFESKFLQFWE